MSRYNAWELKSLIQKVLDIELFMRLQGEQVALLVNRLNELFTANHDNVSLPEYKELNARKRAIEEALSPYYDDYEGERGLHSQAQENLFQFVIEHHEAILGILEPVQKAADAVNPGIVSTFVMVQGFIAEPSADTSEGTGKVDTTGWFSDGATRPIKDDPA